MMTALPVSCFAGSYLLRKRRTLNLFHFPMFYLNLSEMMEHGKRPPISWLKLLSNLKAQTEMHSIM